MTDAFTPAPFRYRWTVTHDVPSPATVTEGRAFRAVRVRYGLTLREVAIGWGIGDVEAGELERGVRRFRTPADLNAALSQLWLWAMEKSKGAIGR